METRHERWERIRPALQDFVEKLLPIYGAALRSVILFGSYARGEEREGSDIDLLLLVDMTDEDLRKLRPRLSMLRLELDAAMPFLDIQPVVVPLQRFQAWKDVHPFYQKIVEDGVSLYEAA